MFIGNGFKKTEEETEAIRAEEEEKIRILKATTSAEYDEEKIRSLDLDYMEEFNGNAEFLLIRNGIHKPPKLDYPSYHNDLMKLAKRDSTKNYELSLSNNFHDFINFESRMTPLSPYTVTKNQKNK